MPPARPAPTESRAHDGATAQRHKERSRKSLWRDRHQAKGEADESAQPLSRPSQPPRCVAGPKMTTAVVSSSAADSVGGGRLEDERNHERGGNPNSGQRNIARSDLQAAELSWLHAPCSTTG